MSDAIEQRVEKTRAAVRELLETVGGMDELFLSGARAVRDEASALEGFRWMFSLLQVALETYVWADPAKPVFTDIVGPHLKWGGDNADAFYCFAPLDPERTYKVRCKKGDAAYLSLTVYGGPRDGRYSSRIVGTKNDRTLEIAADGSFELILSKREHEGNWLRLEDDAFCAITRDYLVHPKSETKAKWSIESLDPASLPPASDEVEAARFRAATVFLREQLGFQPLAYDETRWNLIADPFPVPQVTYGWAAGDAAYAMGSFKLGDDEALVIRGRSPECAFWNMCLWNPYLHTFDYTYERVTINVGQVVYEKDGSWTIVVAAKDPGHPNWVSTAGHGQGTIWFRWFLPSETPAPLMTNVVSRAEATKIEKPVLKT
jgi:hypothetical protein